jgi:hypothetical protein
MRVLVLEMRKKHGSVPKIHTFSGLDSHNEQTPAFKVPLQLELRFRPRRYEQPPHRRACGATSSGRLASILCRSSDGPRTDAAAGRLSFASPLKGREPDIKAKEPEARSADGGGDPVGDEDFFSHHHLSADDGSHLPTGRSPLGSSRTGEHQPPRRGAVLGQRQDSP